MVSSIFGGGQSAQGSSSVRSQSAPPEESGLLGGGLGGLIQMPLQLAESIISLPGQLLGGLLGGGGGGGLLG